MTRPETWPCWSQNYATADLHMAQPRCNWNWIRVLVGHQSDYRDWDRIGTNRELQKWFNLCMFHSNFKHNLLTCTGVWFVSTLFSSWRGLVEPKLEPVFIIQHQSSWWGIGSRPGAWPLTDRHIVLKLLTATIYYQLANKEVGMEAHIIHLNQLRKSNGSIIKSGWSCESKECSSVSLMDSWNN